MERTFALLSVVFMMAFVIVFDRVHYKRCTARFWKTGLLSQWEVDQIRAILSACQQSA